MKLKWIVLGLLAGSLLAGCKLVIKVPEGGSVKSQSGDYDCAEGKTCRYDVDDLEFSDIFTGVGKGDNRFVRWKKRKGGLCGGNTTPCQLATAPLASNPLLLAVLESDEKFFLEPVFSKDGGSDPVGTTSAEVCFNEDMAKAGTTLEIRYRTQNPQLPGDIISDITQNVVGQRTFQGQSALRMDSETSVTQNGVETVATAETYVEIQVNKKRVINLGGSGETIVDGVPSGSVDLVFDPGQLTRFDLTPGQSYTQDYTVRSTTDTGQGTFTDNSEQTLKTVYVGVVPITVPAGDFDACQFESTTTVMQQGVQISSSRTFWLAVNDGLQLKEINDGGTTEMLSGSINSKNL